MSEAEQKEHNAEMITNGSSLVHIGGENLTPKKKFKDPADQIAWDAYKRIERRYSDANRRLAK